VKIMSRLLRARPETVLKASLLWLASYELGHPTVDEQHRRLFDLTKAFLEKASCGKADLSTVQKTLEELVGYARYHFTTEEEFMRDIGYSEASLRSHIAVHDHFVERINELAGRCRQGHPETIREMVRFLVSWLREHIVETDVKYIRFYRRVGPRIATLAARIPSGACPDAVKPVLVPSG